MAENWIAIRNCVTQFQGGHLYKAGDSLLPGDTPNKHFAIDGIVKGAAQQTLPLAPGDDNRSTKQILADLLEKHGAELPADTSRKEAFWTWIEKEKEGGPAAAVTAPDEKEPDVPTAPPDPLAGMDLAAMTPDEINKVKAQEWRDCISNRWGIEMPVRATKAELAERAMMEAINAEKDKDPEPKA